MPTFRPALGQTATVIVPQSGKAYAHLTFLATFAHDEDESGIWEIWTDLPGDGVTGEWRAIPFQPVANGPIPSPRVDADDSPRLKLGATPYVPFESDPTTLVATVTLPAKPGQTCAYTFRRRFDSGDIHWLGWGGFNGEIKLEEGEERPTKGIWTGEPPLDLSWTGVASDLESSTFLPSTTGGSGSLILLTARIPVSSTPFSRISSAPSPAKQDVAHLAILGDKLVNPPNSAVPQAKEGTHYACTTSDDVGEALKDVIELSGGHISFTPLETSDPSVIALTAEASSVLVYGSPCSQLRKVTVTLSQDYSPILVATPSGCLFNATHQLHLELEAGTTAEMLRVTPFSELRGSGADDSIWICAPTATAVEEGEEEVDLPQAYATKAMKDEKMEEMTAIQPVVEDIPTEQDVTGNGLAEEMVETEEPSAKDADEPDTDSWWYLRLIGGFLLNLWNMLFAPFHTETNIEYEAATSEAPSEETAVVDDLPVTPVDERTPLLSSPQISRSMSEISTFPSSASLSGKAADAESHTVVAEVEPSARAVQIRSYTLFTFTSPPPAKFYIPHGTSYIHERLRFSFKPKTSREWREAQPKVSSRDCIELEIDANVDEQDWHVQVERV